MSAKGVVGDAFSCSICLDLLKDPVTIPCGHSNCLTCLDTHWTGEEDKKSYSCPQCKHIFTEKPALVKNTMLVTLMEGLKKNGPPSAAVCPSAPCVKVYCDFCSKRMVRAVKSCLQCLVSYCKKHLQPHYDFPALKRHKLVEPTDNLQEKLCPRHDEVMKMFCRTDQQCICYLCSVDQHKDHHTVTAAAERAEKQRELQVFQKNILLRLDHRQKDVDLLQEQIKHNGWAADAAEELCDSGVRELMGLLEDKMREVKAAVTARSKAEYFRIKNIKSPLQQEVNKLKRTLTELETLSNTEDHVHFLKKLKSLSEDSETSSSVNTNQSPPPYDDIVTAAVSKMRSTLQELNLLEPPAALPKPEVPEADPSPAEAHTTAPPQHVSSEEPPAPPQHLSSEESPASSQHDPESPASDQESDDDHCKVREKLWLSRYFRRITWDPRSVHNEAKISYASKLVHHVEGENHNYPPDELRFTEHRQAVSAERLSGRCFFELMAFSPLNARYGVTVAVTYEDIKRNDSSDECKFGMNAKSWALECNEDFSVFWHKGQRQVIPVSEVSTGFVGVYVDEQEGFVSFFRGMQHVYTAMADFTGPLLAGVRLGRRGQAYLVKTNNF